jgi:hypothetical protein
LENLNIIWSLDWREARGIAMNLSNEYLAGRCIQETQKDLEQQSKELVAQNWLAIEAVANTLLAKEWEALKPLKSGGQWSKQTMAKYVTGDEAVGILEQCGIFAICAPGG